MQLVSVTPSSQSRHRPVAQRGGAARSGAVLTPVEIRRLVAEMLG